MAAVKGEQYGSESECGKCSMSLLSDAGQKMGKM